MELTKKQWHHIVTYRLYRRDRFLSGFLFLAFGSLTGLEIYRNLQLLRANDLILCGIFALASLLFLIWFIYSVIKPILLFRHSDFLKARLTRTIADASFGSVALHYVLYIHGERLEGETESIFQTKNLPFTPKAKDYLGKEVILGVDLKKKYPILIGLAEEFLPE